MLHDYNYIKNKNNKYLNCGMCNKCKRTLFTLDILGVLEKYENIFNLNNYYKVKETLKEN